MILKFVKFYMKWLLWIACRFNVTKRIVIRLLLVSFSVVVFVLKTMQYLFQNAIFKIKLNELTIKKRVSLD